MCAKSLTKIEWHELSANEDALTEQENHDSTVGNGIKEGRSICREQTPPS
jgi:hypothetical protein